MSQEIDNQLVDDVRNFLFGPPGSGGFDLASLNIQRGRDHGLPDYNSVREQLGLERAESFADISSDPDVQAKLAQAYESVDDIDVWVGALAEDHVEGASVGELTRTVLAEQFTALRDGDRFWYQNTFEGSQLREIERTRLSDVIERNTDLTSIQENAFIVPGEGDRNNDGGRRGDGPGNDGPGNDGPGNDGRRNDGPRNDGPGNDGPRNDGPGNDGAGNDGPANDGDNNPPPPPPPPPPVPPLPATSEDANTIGDALPLPDDSTPSVEDGVLPAPVDGQAGASEEDDNLPAPPPPPPPPQGAEGDNRGERGDRPRPPRPPQNAQGGERRGREDGATMAWMKPPSTRFWPRWGGPNPSAATAAG